MLKPYFKKDNFLLYYGSCLEVLKSIPEDSVDMIFADPPYNLSNDGFSVKSGKQVSVNKGSWDKSKGFEEDYDFHFDWISACRKVLKPEGTIWISGTYHSIYQCGYALQNLGFRILNDIAWFKPNSPPNIGCRCFAASHETLIWALKDPKSKYIFNYEEMKYGKWDNDFIKREDKQMKSVWAINTTPRSEKMLDKHPTQKPLKLLDRIIRACTKVGSLVLDPFTGSSTTGISAINLSRTFIGVDNNTDYLNLSIERFKNLEKTGKQIEISH